MAEIKTIVATRLEWTTLTRNCRGIVPREILDSILSKIIDKRLFEDVEIRFSNGIGLGFLEGMLTKIRADERCVEQERIIRTCIEALNEEKDSSMLSVFGLMCIDRAALTGSKENGKYAGKALFDVSYALSGFTLQIKGFEELDKAFNDGDYNKISDILIGAIKDLAR